MLRTDPHPALSLPHRLYPGAVLWRVLPDGVHLEGDNQPMRTVGPPRTASAIWEAYAEQITVVCQRYQLPYALLMALVAAESRGELRATRHEPGYVSDTETPHRASYGLTQTLLSTAREVTGRELRAEDLFHPLVSLDAGAAYVWRQSRATFLDPALVAAAYNAGGLYEDRSKLNQWRLRAWNHGDHITRFCKFYGDALAVLPGPSA